MWRSLVSRLNGVQEAASSNLVTRTNLEDLKSYDFESSFLLSQTFRSVSKCRTISVSNGFLTDSSTRAMQTVGQLLRQSLFAGIVQMTINVCCHLNIAVTHPFLYILEVAAVIQKQTGAAMPLRYNYDKPEKPRISRVFGYLARFFHPFPNRKIEPRSSYIVGGVIVTTKTKYRLGGQSAHPRNQDISSEKKKCPFFVPKIRCRQEEYDD